jgi:hypothetical protein
MTTIADIERITRVARQRSPHWILRKEWLIVPPIDHYVRGFYFRRSSSPRLFYLSYTISPLYEPDMLGFGARFGASFGSEAWGLQDSGVEDELAVRCEQESVRFSGIRSPKAFLRYAADFTNIEWSEHLILSHALAGDPVLAKKILLRTLFELELDDWYKCQVRTRFVPDRHLVSKKRRLRRLLATLNEGSDRTEAFLRTLERINIRKLELQEHWTSPWPRRKR